MESNRLPGGAGLRNRMVGEATRPIHDRRPSRYFTRGRAGLATSTTGPGLPAIASSEGAYNVHRRRSRTAVRRPTSHDPALHRPALPAPRHRPHHPERPDRLRAVTARLAKSGVAGLCVHGDYQPLSAEEVTAVHEPRPGAARPTGLRNGAAASSTPTRPSARNRTRWRWRRPAPAPRRWTP